MGWGTCGKHGREKRCMWCGNLRKKDVLQNLGVDGRTILKWVFKKQSRSVDWIDLSQDRAKRWAVVNTVR
jgi:hypothetical protein